MLPLNVNLDVRLFLRKVFTSNLRAISVAFPMYLHQALEKNNCTTDARVIKRLQRLAYKSLRSKLTDSGSFRVLVETMLNERPELLAQLMCAVYLGKVGTSTDWKYLHKTIVTQAYPKKEAMDIVDRSVADKAAETAMTTVNKDATGDGNDLIGTGNGFDTFFGDNGLIPFNAAGVATTVDSHDDVALSAGNDNITASDDVKYAVGGYGNDNDVITPSDAAGTVRAEIVGINVNVGGEG